MRPVIRLAVAATAALLLAGCSDAANSRLLAPSRADAMALPPGWPPKYDPEANQFVEITAGRTHTCARTKVGVMYCWGGNYFGSTGIVPATVTYCGQYGFGLTPCITKPTRVTGSATVNGVAMTMNTATSIRAGVGHTCALAAGGVAWCWGTNFWGEVGDGNGGYLHTQPTPVPVAGGLSFTSIDAGGGATCGTTNNYLLYCWGELRYDKPQGLTPHLYSWQASWAGGASVGEVNACARSLQGGTACFGDNDRSQLGLDRLTWPYFDAPLIWGPWTTAVKVEAGTSVICTEAPDGTLSCMGDNTYGQLAMGYGNLAGYSANPQTVMNGIGQPMQLHGVTIGARHVCALTPTGVAICWGDNSAGQLGISGPVGGIMRNAMEVETTMTFRALAAGQYHTCGIGVDNHIYCWGDNAEGQLAQPMAPVHGQTVPIQAQDP